MNNGSKKPTHPTTLFAKTIGEVNGFRFGSCSMGRFLTAGSGFGKANPGRFFFFGRHFRLFAATPRSSCRRRCGVSASIRAGGQTAIMERAEKRLG